MWPKKLLHTAATVIDYSSQVAGITAAVFLVAMMLLTVADVFLRYFFNSPIIGSQELIEYLMVLAGFLGLALCALKGGHVKVDLLVNRLSPRVQAIIDSIMLLTALTVLPLLVWQIFIQARYTHIKKISSVILRIPDCPFYAAEGLGFLLLVLVTVILLVNHFRNIKNR